MTATRATALASILHSRVMNEFVQVLDALLSEVDPEDLIRHAKKGSTVSDERPLDEAVHNPVRVARQDYDLDFDADETITERIPITMIPPNPHG